jgi:hypothetical protein
MRRGWRPESAVISSPACGRSGGPSQNRTGHPHFQTQEEALGGAYLRLGACEQRQRAAPGCTEHGPTALDGPYSDQCQGPAPLATEEEAGGDPPTRGSSANCRRSLSADLTQESPRGTRASTARRPLLLRQLNPHHQRPMVRDPRILLLRHLNHPCLDATATLPQRARRQDVVDLAQLTPEPVGPPRCLLPFLEELEPTRLDQVAPDVVQTPNAAQGWLPPVCRSNPR